jgi:hypothetical protein
MKTTVIALFLSGLVASPGAMCGSLLSCQKSAAARSPASSDRLLLALARPSKLFGSGAFVPAPARQKDLTPDKPTVNAADFIPTDMTINPDLEATQKTEFVVNRIADHSLTTYFNSPDFRKSSLGRSATEVEKKVTQEVVLKGASKDSIEHKFNFQVQAFQALAKVQYIGFAQFSVSYNFRYETADIELAEHLNKRQSIAIVHSKTQLESKSHVRLSWSF